MKPRRPSAEDADASCRQCKHFHERTEAGDGADWGECWRDPPEMGYEADEADEPTPVPLIRWLYLPYVCASITPRQ